VRAHGWWLFLIIIWLFHFGVHASILSAQTISYTLYIGLHRMLKFELRSVVWSSWSSQYASNPWICSADCMALQRFKLTLCKLTADSCEESLWSGIACLLHLFCGWRPPEFAYVSPSPFIVLIALLRLLFFQGIVWYSIVYGARVPCVRWNAHEGSLYLNMSFFSIYIWLGEDLIWYKLMAEATLRLDLVQIYGISRVVGGCEIHVLTTLPNIQ
jgi:hypothetical protein